MPDHPDPKRQRLSSTLPASEFSAGAGVAPPQAGPSAARLTDGQLDPSRKSIRGPEDGSEGSDGRFSIEGVIGSGATSSVIAVLDRNLGRSVAAKKLNDCTGEDVSRFLEEARITASLQHPNVLPVYDLEVDARGEMYFLMKRVTGGSLADAINVSSHATRSPRIDGPNAIVSIFIGIANALACAHAAGIVHQDIKPDNIMLGEFGEALLVDWGSAVRMRATSSRLYGTPLYMSPEQARREFADERSDIYCLGGTLLHALLLRCPTWSDDSDEFWRRKRLGELDPISDAERKRVPTRLLAIALKALAPEPDRRYASTRDLIRDLESFQAGLAVSAYRDSWWDRIRRWHRRHARVLWTATASGTAILILAALLYGERLKEVAQWGPPAVVERFADDSWLQRWEITSGSGEVRDGRLITTGPQGTTLTFREPIRGDVAIDFEGEMLPGGFPAICPSS